MNRKSDHLFLFFREPEPDRWMPLDRFPRRVVRKLLGRAHYSGAKKVFYNLRQGLERLSIPYTANDQRAFRRDPNRPVGFIGKRSFLGCRTFPNPLVLGPAILDHPLQDADLMSRTGARAFVVPCEWYRRMFSEYWSETIHVWPVGIDTHEWCGVDDTKKRHKFFVYDKVSFRGQDSEILDLVTRHLDEKGFTYTLLRYGKYTERQLRQNVRQSECAVVLSHTETQGIAYQQMMASGLPVLAWNPGTWDTNKLRSSRSFLPPNIRFENTSVPYFDERCGCTFRGIDDFEEAFGRFREGLAAGRFAPRDYVLENLSLERSASAYAEILRSYT